jgi:hypothetical protein
MALIARAEVKMTIGSHRMTTPHSSVIVSARQYRICNSLDCCAVIIAPTSKYDSEAFHVGGEESSVTL